MICSFLLIGQSNMSGRGFVDEAVSVNFDRIKVLRNGRWWPVYRPVNPDRKTAGVNLAESFAERFVADHDCEVGLIPCADGGTKLSQWMPGEVLFDNAVNCARLAQRTSKIVGILWHQGESDCAPALSATYRERFQVMITELRAQLGLEDVPLILGGLGDFLAVCPVSKALANYPAVNAALQELAAEDPHTAFASAEGLGANPDNLHFSAAALHEFGLRYYSEFSKLFDPAVLSEDAPEDTQVITQMEHL